MYKMSINMFINKKAQLDIKKNNIKKNIVKNNFYNKIMQENNNKINLLMKYKNKYSPVLFDKLITIHRNLKLDFGSFLDEYTEQMMAVRYITGNEKVLEIGGNIGRNSLVIAYILNQNNNNNFVSLESDKEISKQLIHNKEINNLNFHVESSALSKRNLIQKGWDTIVSDVILDGYKKVDIINFYELKNKYCIDFDTLVIDCEGAFYYILLDMPEILNNINLIIMENDYLNESHKIYIDEILKNNGFEVDYTESGGWGHFVNNFFEVWKKNI